MTPEVQVVPVQWKLKRKRTTIMFFFSWFVQGLEFTTIYSTLWSYVNHGLNNSNPDLSYGLIACGRSVAVLLFGTVVSRWFDRTRSMRKVILTVSLLMNLGYASYMLHYSLEDFDVDFNDDELRMKM